MAVNIENTVSVDAPRDYFTLEEIREFVENTATFAGETKVNVQAHSLRNAPYVKLSAQYGDMTGNY